MGNEDNKIEPIQEAETEPVESSWEAEESSLADPAADAKQKRSDYFVELALFLLLGILVGFAAKTEAVKKITMGFDDYQLKNAGEFYKINDLQLELAKKPSEQASGTQDGQGSSDAPAGFCSQP